MAIRLACALSILMGLVGPVAAQDCRLALVLGLDVSSSVDAAEHRLQREGLAGALTDPEIVAAFLLGDPVALHVFEWSDQAYQRDLSSGWRLIEDAGDLHQVASHIRRHERESGAWGHVRTAVGAALAHAAADLADAPDCRARTVDLASDGESNDGIAPADAHRIFLLDGVTVNALVIGRLGGPGTPDDPVAEKRATQGYDRLVGHFMREVLRGPDAFWVWANGYEDYQRAMTVKLLRELELPPVSGWPASGNAG